MANGASAAVTEATRLQEIGFAEFTSTLINEVFDALIAANLRQMEAYIGLLQAAALTLTDFISRTEDDISPQEVVAFLERFGGLELEQRLTNEQVGALNAALELSTTAGVDENNRVAATTSRLTQEAKDTIEAAVAKRIVANRFELLQETVRQGALRLIVDNGIIETRLTFSTYGRSDRSKSTSERLRDESVAASGGGAGVGFGGTGGAITGGFGAGFAAGRAATSLNVSTAKSSERDVTGSRVQIYGRVEIHFKTDYAPLSGR